MKITGMKTAFVTGSTGFLGLNLVKQLLEQKWRVHALHRQESNLTYLNAMTCDHLHLHVGDINDFNSLLIALPEKVDAFFHLAASTNHWSNQNEIQYKINVIGSSNAAKAAWQRHAQKFIHTSSISVYGVQNKTINDQSPMLGKDSWVNYFRTKFLAEQKVKEFIRDGLAVTIINPANIIGPFDFHNWSRMITLLDQDRLPGVFPGSGSFCHVREVAKAHIQAVKFGKIGENYLLGGADHSYLELVQLICQHLGKKPPKKTMPAFFVYALAYFWDWVSRISHKQPDLTPELAEILCNNMICDSSKAIKHLGYQVIPLDEMLIDCLQWLQEQGRLNVTISA